MYHEERAIEYEYVAGAVAELLVHLLCEDAFFKWARMQQRRVPEISEYILQHFQKDLSPIVLAHGLDIYRKCLENQEGVFGWNLFKTMRPEREQESQKDSYLCKRIATYIHIGYYHYHYHELHMAVVLPAACCPGPPY